MAKHKLVALLPMKANSERVKGKNFRDLAGKPLYRWILDALLLSPEIDLVVINTDAREILADQGLVSTDRVLIRDRKPEICGDFVSMNLILADDIEAVPADLYIMTHTTNPLLSSRSIAKAISVFRAAHERGEADSLFSVTKRQTRFYAADGAAINHDPNNLIRTQDLPPYFEENSCLYVFPAETFRASQARIGARPILFETAALESIDIDEPSDWFMAEALAQRVARGDQFPESAP